jgi:hypothetical protein
MRKTIVLALLLAAVASHAEAATRKLSATLRGIEEVPAISTAGLGSFNGNLNGAETELTFTLTFAGTKADVTQSHIHFAQKGVNGGIVVFLCSNLGNGPAGTPACPVSGGTVDGTRGADDVLAVTAQGIGASEFKALVKAIKGGNAYVNVHSTSFPGGEIRGQIRYQGPKKAEGEGEDDAP